MIGKKISGEFLDLRKFTETNFLAIMMMRRYLIIRAVGDI